MIVDFAALFNRGVCGHRLRCEKFLHDFHLVLEVLQVFLLGELLLFEAVPLLLLLVQL